MTLDELAIRYGTDKGSRPAHGLSGKGYARHYERLLDGRRREPIRLLEIGVWLGASLRMWAAYLPNAEIVGVDRRPTSRRFTTARTRIVIGDQGDPATLAQLAALGPFDVIVDDGAHTTAKHRASFGALFPSLRAGGFYAIEDLHVAPASRPWLAGLGATFPIPGLGIVAA
jgi:cephalosporin hydroxylase